MNKVWQIFAWITINFTLGFLLLIIFWLVYPYKVIEFKQPIKILTPQVKRGEHLSYEVDYCKYSNHQPLITRTFIDGVIYQVPDGISKLNDKGCGVNTIQMYIPKALPTGKFYVEINYHYELNPVRKLDITVKTEQFEIIN